MQWAEIDSRIQALGLILRGGFHPEPADQVSPLPDGRVVKTVVLVGNAGDSMWKAFAQIDVHRGEADPLNRWTREVLSPVAEQCNAHVVFPFEAPPFLPFQRWAQRAESVTPSPIGPLIHPDYGLWHAYRAALLFAAPIELPPFRSRPSPCETCETRPCLAACPVDALSPGRFDLKACRDHIANEAGAECLHYGCLARRACPIGREFMYVPAQMRFHMKAFLRSAKER